MSFGEPGGEVVKPKALKREVMRAELAEAIRGCCLQHSAKIADAILDKFDIYKIGA